MQVILEALRLPNGELADGSAMLDTDTYTYYTMQDSCWVKAYSYLEYDDLIERPVTPIKVPENACVSRPRAAHKTNCPNCGAPIRGCVCEYCDTILDMTEYKQQEREVESIRRRLTMLEMEYANSISRKELLDGMLALQRTR